MVSGKITGCFFFLTASFNSKGFEAISKVKPQTFYYDGPNSEDIELCDKRGG
jgi:hypothetical protein